MLQDFHPVLADVGYDRPRLKVLPPLRIGSEVSRDRPYDEAEAVTVDMMAEYPFDLLLCSSARLVTSTGVWACPDSPRLLIGSPGGYAGRSGRGARPPCGAGLLYVLGERGDLLEHAWLRDGANVRSYRRIAVFGGVYSNHLALAKEMRDEELPEEFVETIPYRLVDHMFGNLAGERASCRAILAPILL